MCFACRELNPPPPALLLIYLEIMGREVRTPRGARNKKNSTPETTHCTFLWPFALHINIIYILKFSKILEIRENYTKTFSLMWNSRFWCLDVTILYSCRNISWFSVAKLLYKCLLLSTLLSVYRYNAYFFI